MSAIPVSAPEQPTRRRALTLAALMAATAGATILARPRSLLAAVGPRVDLEAMVPRRFGEWQIDPTFAPIQPSPDVIEKIASIYDATLNRTYINSRYQRVMLSIAYGGDQTGRLRVHRPESCYSAQGFAVTRVRDERVQFGSVAIPVKRLIGRLGGRNEPITYWIRVGEETVTGNIGQRLAQLRYGLAGEVPDGLIFRVSSIASDAEAAFRQQDSFIASLLAGADASTIERLVGKSRGDV